MRAMHHKIMYAFLILAFAAPTFGQTSAVFQNGVTMLPGGGLYGGAIDTEFRAANPTTAQDANPGISIDQFDAGFQTQGALRFENLLISDGGIVPNGLASGDILFAELRLWVTSNSNDNATISFSRVVGQDTTSSDFWQSDDTWASLGGDLIPDEAGLLDGDTILRNDIEAAAIPDFVEANPGLESSDRLTAGMDAGLSLPDAFDQAFFRYNATDAVRDWLVGGQPNFGWAINNDTGNGWDFLSSEFSTPSASDLALITDAGLIPENLRPSLTIVFASGPLLDLDGDGDVDELDFGSFLDQLAIELDGPIATGSPGDFDFDRDVDLDDFQFFKQNYADQNAMFPPSGAGSIAGATVPEPSSVALVALALLGLVGLRRRAQD